MSRGEFSAAKRRSRATGEVSRRLGPRLAAVLVLAAAVALAAPATRPASASSAAAPVITVSDGTLGAAVPPRFAGFSIEAANLCHVLSLAASDPAFVRLFLNMGPGIFRVGGDTGDTFASWSTTAAASCQWNHLVVTPALVKSFFSFAKSVGYQVMWQVPLGNAAPAADAAQAAYVSTMPGVYSIEFGNEPNIYPNCPANSSAYISEWGTVYRQYRADGGTAPVTGPASTSLNACYAPAFLAQHAGDISALTVHYYVAGASTHPTCGDLLNTSGLDGAARIVAQQGAAHHLPVIMNETNSYDQHGQPGVSNAFCSSLWAADYTMFGIRDGLRGIYFHGAANYPPGDWRGVRNYITPINANGTPAPEYYGLLFCHQMTQAGGNQVHTASSGVPSDISSYAIAGGDGNLRVALINPAAAPVSLAIHTARSYQVASEISLRAPSLTATSGVTLGSASVAAGGTWTPQPQAVPVSGSAASVTVPAHSGVIVTYSPH